MKLRLLDFNVYDQKVDEDDEEDTDHTFVIQIFGISNSRESVVLFIEDFKPHFYAKINNRSSDMLSTLKTKTRHFKWGKILFDNCRIVKRRKLYGFDNKKLHDFWYLEFSTLACFNYVKNFWYEKDENNVSKLKADGFLNTTLYEGQIPPLLRFFHIYDISPSGWVEIEDTKLRTVSEKTTSCKREYRTFSNCLKPLKGCDELVPLKICSFDIEASSSHGDFPVPKKSYKKLAYNIVDSLMDVSGSLMDLKVIIPKMIKQSFGFILPDDELFEGVQRVYCKKPITLSNLEKRIDAIITSSLQSQHLITDVNRIEDYFHKIDTNDDENEYDYGTASTMTTITSTNKPKRIDRETNLLDILTDAKCSREDKITVLSSKLDEYLPNLKGDEVTFIGSTFQYFGEKEPYLNNCILSNTCSKTNLNPNTELVMCRSEKDVLLEWTKLIQKEDPDIIIGYNIFGFDYKFLFFRAEENDCLEPFLRLSRNRDEVCCRDKNHEYKLDETISVLASGEHELYYIKMNGRVQIDLLNYFRREENLPSYKLDYVAGYYIGGWVDRMELDSKTRTTKIISSNLYGLLQGSFIHLELIDHTTEYYNDGQKFEVILVNKQTESETTESFFVVNGLINDVKETKKMRWGLAKDDVTPQDIFRMTKESDDSRYLIAKYCLQDCNLLHYLLNKVDVITGFIEMSSICSVPISFLVFRGQGIKLTSYVAKKCREMNTLMPVLERVENDEGYEGATVLEPKCNLYLDTPVACVDYASLYPSSMISENLSHDSKVLTREYDLSGRLLKEQGEIRYDNLPGYEYVDIQYDTFKYVRKSKTSQAEKIRCGYKICRFAQFPNDEKAIMPMILMDLLKARKTTRNLIKTEKDEFMRNVLDKRQLGYKVTANSLYGQCGAKTSTFFDKDIAASTTATGRTLLIYAKTVIEEVYAHRVCSTKSHGDVITNAEYIYGDTDSVFFAFNLKTMDRVPITGRVALEITIELAQQAGALASSFLKAPHDLEYEKTFMPFCLLSKKRYVGMLYETNPDKCKRKEMGIVLKRRDNAPIVKDIYGGIIDILMKEKNIEGAIQFLKENLQNLTEEKCAMEKLIISKSLRSEYKKPNQIAHKVLADRIAARDPGNKPNSGDRIPFIYIVNPKARLQGEKIETPSFILENKLKIDYSFYITNQIMNPIQQLFALVLEQIWRNSNKIAKLKKFEAEINKVKLRCQKEQMDEKKINDKLLQMRNEEVKELLFDPFLRITQSRKNSCSMITSFFGAKI